ncbi:Gluconolactonase [Buttiauxella agrestis]|uniref:Gluconolactonase n=1 Tax=Buttiauxella agrestis TaxID=82977 RepID=A0A381C345_9ENTR|nr:YncE family protein [Buttiauxella agrestis]SUW62320.1 Gluconolactonase [Buttiauxella agrestis]
MNRHTLYGYQKSGFIALTVALLMNSLSASAKPLPEKDFLTVPMGNGVYELAYDASQNVLFAASAPSFDKDKTDGLIYKLNPDTLKATGKITTERRAFAAVLDAKNHILYIGNTLEGSVTLMDTRSGKEIKTVQLSDLSNPKEIIHTREMVLDKKRQRLYVSGVTQKGIIWVIDTQKQQHIGTIENMGEYPTGLAIDEEKGRVYAVNGSGELITLDASDNKILSRIKVEPQKKHFFLNIAVDDNKERAFITDPDLPNVLVVSLKDGKIIHQIDVINSLAVMYNATRNEIYITHRNAQLISIVDSKTYKVKASISTTALPNSLALSADGNTLYASVKQGEKEMGKQPDYIIKIDLNKI